MESHHCGLNPATEQWTELTAPEENSDRMITSELRPRSAGSSRKRLTGYQANGKILVPEMPYCICFQHSQQSEQKNEPEMCECPDHTSLTRSEDSNQRRDFLYRQLRGHYRSPRVLRRESCFAAKWLEFFFFTANNCGFTAPEKLPSRQFGATNHAARAPQPR